MDLQLVFKSHEQLDSVERVDKQIGQSPVGHDWPRIGVNSIGQKPNHEARSPVIEVA